MKFKKIVISLFAIAFIAMPFMMYYLGNYEPYDEVALAVLKEDYGVKKHLNKELIEIKPYDKANKHNIIFYPKTGISPYAYLPFLKNLNQNDYRINLETYVFHRFYLNNDKVSKKLSEDAKNILIADSGSQAYAMQLVEINSLVDQVIVLNPSEQLENERFYYLADKCEVKQCEVVDKEVLTGFYNLKFSEVSNEMKETYQLELVELINEIINE